MAAVKCFFVILVIGFLREASCSGHGHHDKHYRSKDYPSNDYPSKDYPSKDYPKHQHPKHRQLEIDFPSGSGEMNPEDIDISFLPNYPETQIEPNDKPMRELDIVDRFPKKKELDRVENRLEKKSVKDKLRKLLHKLEAIFH